MMATAGDGPKPRMDNGRLIVKGDDQARDIQVSQRKQLGLFSATRPRVWVLR